MIFGRIAAIAAALALAAPPASAQLIGGGLPGVSLPSPDLGDVPLERPAPPRTPRVRTPRVDSVVRETAPALAGAVDEVLSDVGRLRLDELIRAHPEAVELDDAGAPVVRGRVLAIAPTPEALEAARQAGFEVVEEVELAALGLRVTALRPPEGMSAREAVRRLRALDPAGGYEFDHLYAGAGGADGASGRAGGSATQAARGLRIGLVDTGVDARHPTFVGARLEQRGFGPGGLRAQAHGTAVASLLAGRDGRFRGAAPGARLLVADVYGQGPTGGSASILARAFAWLAEARTPVINISLVGPPNRVLEAAVKGLTDRGHLLVAAVGNDGPAAPPLYPAAYPGVVAVTAVDAGGRILLEAGRGDHVDVAAPGADMAAARAGGGYTRVRGASFAAPLVAGLLARRLARPDPAAASSALAGLQRSAKDLGPRGRDRTFGAGLVAADLRVPAARVAARAGVLAGN